jgi:putative flippase GtrA
VKSQLLRHKQFILYCVIGSCGAALTLLSFGLLVRLGRVGYQQANVVSYTAGTLLSFLLNSFYNFRVFDRPLRRFAAFFAVSMVGLAVSAALLRLMVGIWRFDAYAAYPVIVLAVAIIQFNLNRAVSFAKSG